MTDKEKKLFDRMKLLVEAIRFNHNISGDIEQLHIEDSNHEIEVYQKLSTEENKKLLIDAIKFNHNIPENDNIGDLYIEDPEHEIEVYQNTMRIINGLNGGRKNSVG